MWQGKTRFAMGAEPAAAKRAGVRLGNRDVFSALGDCDLYNLSLSGQTLARPPRPTWFLP